jgi:2-octaprenyl-6-methoxyphenol hydroxylase
MNNKNTYHIIISGGGAAGLALAALLGNAGLTVALIEPSPPAPLAKTAPTSRTAALMEGSINILKSCGVWKKIEPFSTPVKTMRIIDDSVPQNTNIHATFPAGEIGLDRFGYNVPNAILRAALFETVKKIKTISIHPNALETYTAEKNQIQATLENGKKISASLIVGADGRASKIRTIAGIAFTEKDYAQSAITCLFSHTKPHDHISTEFHRPSGPFALVPMRGNHSAGVWVEPSKRADEILRLKKTEFQSLLQKNTRGILGDIAIESGPEIWPLRPLKSKSLIAPRMALIAEAAHTMSPIAAQGLNLSLRDVAALAETVIDSARAGIDIGAAAVLETYAARRKADIGMRTFGVDKMNGIVSADWELIKKIRRGGLSAIGSVSPVKKFAMRQALAPDIDQGRLSQG